MNGTPGASRHLVFLLVIAGVGAWLRLDQFGLQVVTDDEWHALVQLFSGSPGQFLLSFGYADYSIPLALLYWCEAAWFGITEWGMRWPMLSAGLLILLLFPLRASSRLGWRVALLFALLLAISPLLINYSRQARPYGLTLLLGYLAHWAFLRYSTRDEGRLWSGLLYGGSTALAGWLHLVSLPFVLAPFLPAGLAALRGWRHDQGAAVLGLLRLGLPSALLIALLIGPPLLADPGALLNKAGSDMPTWDTLLGVWHTWLGTPLSVAVLVCLGLAAAGLPRLWRDEPLTRSVLLGLFLALALLLMARPAWIHSPLAFARYLLPAQPLLLLAVAVGAVRLADAVARRWGGRAAIPVLALPVVLLLAQTPLAETMRKPNGNALHSTFQADYRTGRHGAREIIRDRTPLSAWWTTLRSHPRASLTIAAAPYYHYSPRWDAPRWEALGRQRVVPGFLTGLCVGRRDGEPPRDPRFVLRNAVHLADAADLRAKGIDMVVFQKPYRDMNRVDGNRFGEDTAHCLEVLRRRFGGVLYEDDKIAVFPVNAVTHDRQ